MNTARNRDAAQLALELSQKSTEELKTLIRDTKQPIQIRRAAAHVLMARAITE